jgi:hypothetical protein
VSGWFVLALAVGAWLWLPARAREAPLARELWYLLLAVALVRALYGTYRFVLRRGRAKNDGIGAPLILWLALPCVATGAFTADSRDRATAEPVEPERLLYLLEYLAADYDSAVREGGILDPYEYVEMLTISRALVDRAGDLLAHGAPQDITARLGQLRDDILARRPPAEVRSAARRIALEVLERLDSVSLPSTAPDHSRARELYDAGCEPCHGSQGGGDGRAARGMQPPPVSFRHTRMSLVSPHQMYVAISHGIDGTAMPSFSGAYAPAEMWDLAFFVLTLREGFEPCAPEVDLPFTSRELALLANDELLERARRAWPRARPEHIDYYRSTNAPSRSRSRR